MQIAGGVAGLSKATMPAPFRDQKLPEKVLDLLVYDYVAYHKPRLFAVLRLAGVLDEEFKPRPQNAGELGVAYVERQLVLERVADAVTDPGSLPGRRLRLGHDRTSAPRSCCVRSRHGQGVRGSG